MKQITTDWLSALGMNLRFLPLAVYRLLRSSSTLMRLHSIVFSQNKIERKVKNVKDVCDSPSEGMT